MIKRRAQGKKYGLAILSEGLLESIGEKGLIQALGDDLPKYGEVTRDDHGHLRLGEIEFGRIIRNRVGERLKDLGLKITMIDKDLGYELRCADPIPFDAEYTRNLGFGAVKFLTTDLSNDYGAIVNYEVARRYMIRLEKSDFDDAVKLAALAKVVKMTGEQFKQRFEYVV